MAQYSELHYVYQDEAGEEAQSDEIDVGSVRSLLQAGTVTAATKVWTDGMDDWVPLGSCADLFGLRDSIAPGEEGEPPEFHCLHYAYTEAGAEAQSDEITTAEARALLEAGTITAATKVWTDGMDDWIPLAKCASRFGLAAALPEGTPPAASAGDDAEPTVHYTDEAGEDEAGEATVAELQQLIDSGTVAAGAKLWMEGWDEWLAVADCADKLGLALPAVLAVEQRLRDAQAAATPSQRPLHLHVDRAVGLAAADSFGKSDPYVTIVFNGVKLGQTQTINQDLDPIWDERRQLPPLRHEHNRLDLTMYDRDDGAARGDFLGQVTIDLDDPASIGVVQTCELAPMANKNDKFNKFVQGQLTFAVEYDQVCSVYVAVKETKVRASHDTKSQQVGVIKPGAMIEALEERSNKGTVRIRTAAGWATAKKAESQNLQKTDAAVSLIQDGSSTSAWLDAKSHARQPWKRFWFELQGDTLSYYKSNSQGKGTERQGVIPLHSCRGVADSPHGAPALELNCATRVWSLRASTLEDREILFAALSASVEGSAGGGARAVSFDSVDHQHPGDEDDDWHLHCKCEVLDMSSPAEARSFHAQWMSLENGTLKLEADKKAVERDRFLFDVDEDSIRLGFDKKQNSQDPAREFQFRSGSATYLVRVATPAMVEQWCDALRSVFHDTSKSLYHEGQVHQVSPQDATVHLSITVEGSLLKMYDGHGYSKAVRLAKCHSLRRGFQSTGTDNPQEFSLVHQEDSGERVVFEFRAGSPASRECWFTVLKRELTRVAKRSASDPVQRLNEKLMAITAAAPLLDEDIHCVLYNQPGFDGDEVEEVGLAATEAACTVYLPVEEDVGSHGRVMLIPFTPVAKTLSIETPVMQIQEELVKEYVQPTMDPGTPGGTPGRACRWALFMHRQLGLPPLRCTDTDNLGDIKEFVWQVSHGIQPRLVLADLSSQEEKERLQSLMIATDSAEATSEFPELRPFTAQINAITQMVQEEVASDNRVAMQQRYLLAAHSEGSWSNTGGTVQKSMINLTSSSSSAGAGGGGVGEEEIVFQGWLMKKGGSGAGDGKTSHMFKRRNWKTRCVTLCAKQLMYYDSEESAEKGPSVAKGGILFKGASMEIFDADDERKRGHQFYLKGETVDGSYAGKRDLVMCAQSAAEYVEWEKLLLTHIANANGGEAPVAEAAAAAQKFEVAVGTSLEPEAEPFVTECSDSSTVKDIVEGWLESKEAGWRAEHSAMIESVVVYRRALSEVLQHADTLVDYDFVHLALSTHTGPQTLRIELTVQIDQEYSEAAGGAAPAPVDDPELEFRLHGLRWLRPTDRSAVDDSTTRGGDDDVNEKFASIVDGLRRDPLIDVEGDAKAEIWNHRGEFCAYPQMLPKVIQAVPSWSNPNVLRSLDHVLRTWAKPSPEEALQLLDPRFWAAAIKDEGETRANPLKLEEDDDEEQAIDTAAVNSLIVRDYAVHCLVTMPDHAIQSYILQLSQLMKLERNLSDSPLAALLMYRALRNPTLIGQSLYWSIRSELYDGSVYSHLSLYLRQYMDHCGAHRQELAHQERLMGQLRNMIRHIKSERVRRKAAGEDYSIHVLKEVLHADLAEIEFPPEGIRMPVNPNLRCKAPKIESCKVMGSHQVPLWLVFENYDPTAEPVYIIFKDGDDVRQDTLVLQLFNIMQDTWEEDGLDIPLRPGTTGAYGCVSVGFEVGVVEVVTHCSTLAGIVKEAELGALGVFNQDVYKDWLEKHNETDEKWAAAVDRFTRSCAGYCVATYILGIADRHNDNIMLAQTGELIHIDFGHFLGHVTEFLGLNRDKSPFILTDEFVVIMGGADGAKNPNFRKFVGLCCSCFNSLRKRAHWFINLLSVMLIAKLGELEGMQELDFVRKRFMLDLDDKQAADKFKQLIQTSLNTLTTKLNWAAHSWVHRNH